MLPNPNSPGQDIHACGSTPTLREMATMLSKATGKNVDTLGITKEEFYSEKHKESVGDLFWPQYRNYVEGCVTHSLLAAVSNLPVAHCAPRNREDLANIYTYRLFRLNVDQAEKIVPHVWSFKQWAAQSVELKYAIETMSRQDSDSTAVQSQAQSQSQTQSPSQAR